ncbi:hypothetical protein B0H21DRAFT_291286 [Amylocystis lapponica]|nr:hypothetical protein B0H21DRAFT_291286 [Amylocystis lapponica]
MLHRAVICPSSTPQRSASVLGTTPPVRVLTTHLLSGGLSLYCQSVHYHRARILVTSPRAFSFMCSLWSFVLHLQVHVSKPSPYAHRHLHWQVFSCYSCCNILSDICTGYVSFVCAEWCDRCNELAIAHVSVSSFRIRSVSIYYLRERRNLSCCVLSADRTIRAGPLHFSCTRGINTSGSVLSRSYRIVHRQAQCVHSLCLPVLGDKARSSAWPSYWKQR